MALRSTVHVTRRPFCWVILLALVPAGGSAASTPAGSTPPDSVPRVLPAGMAVSIRFLHSLSSGRDSVGTPVVAQVMETLTRNGCAVVSPRTRVSGHVVASRDSRGPGSRGVLSVVFDALEARPGQWVPIQARLQSLEYPGGNDIRNGTTVRAPRHTARRLIPLALAGIADVDLIPFVALGGLLLLRHAPAVHILAGETAHLQFSAPVALPPGHCPGVAPPADSPAVSSLPVLQPYTTDRDGTRRADPINLIIRGTAAELDTAFRRAGWVRARARSLFSVVRGVVAAALARPARTAPVSNQYFAGRRQDLSYELAGPNARIRHHLRLWRLPGDSIWVAAADMDVGLLIQPLHRRATHRIDPDIDGERDYVVASLEATGCARTAASVTLPGTQRTWRNLQDQDMTTDGRTTVLAMGRCPGG